MARMALFNPALAGCAYDMAVQVDDPIFYVDINFVIFYRS